MFLEKKNPRTALRQYGGLSEPKKPFSLAGRQERRGAGVLDQVLYVETGPGLDLDRETVRRSIRLKRIGGSKSAIPPAGSGPPSSSKPAISTAGNNSPSCSKGAISTAGNGPPRSKGAISPAGKSGRQSLCKPYHRQIERKIELGLSAQRIFTYFGAKQLYPFRSKVATHSGVW